MNQKNMLYAIGTSVVLAILAVIVAGMLSKGQVDQKLNNADRSLTLWGIQPGLGTVMIEYSTRFNNVWWAVDAGNWDMANYQLKELLEIQEVGEVTRSGRAAGLKNFEDKSVQPMIDAVKAKDQAAFTAAYGKAITGCNQCHSSEKDGNGDSFAFVKIVQPTGTSPFSNVDWQGQ